MAIETDRELLNRIADAGGLIPLTVPIYYNPQQGQGVPVYAPVPMAAGIVTEAREIYFYYLSLGSDGSLQIDHYHQTFTQPIDPAALPDLLQALAINARAAQPNNPPPMPDHDFQNMVFTSVCYMAFFIDVAAWDFLCELDGNDQPILTRPFVPFHARAKDTGNSAAGGPPPRKPEPNLSFRNAQVYNLAMPGNAPGNAQRQALCWLNLVLNTQGNQKPGPSGQRYVVRNDYDLFLRAALMRSTDGRRITLVIDPGGDNEGPP